MDFSLYQKCIRDLGEFPEAVKVLRIVGIGEPLLHPELLPMIRFAHERKVANTLELLTNGVLLTPTITDELVASGLDRLVISLQGTSAAKYREICGADVDFEAFLENLRYLYGNRRNLHVYIKIVDCALNGAEDEERFYRLFGDLCDTIAIEHAVPIHHGVDYADVLRDDEEPKTQFGLPVTEMTVCPQPFFTMQVNPDGNVVPCYSFEYPVIVGNAGDMSLQEIWNGDSFQSFRRRMLEGLSTAGSVCADCQISRYRLFPEDDLTPHADRLKCLFE